MDRTTAIVAVGLVGGAVALGYYMYSTDSYSSGGSANSGNIAKDASGAIVGVDQGLLQGLGANSDEATLGSAVLAPVPYMIGGDKNDLANATIGVEEDLGLRKTKETTVYLSPEQQETVLQDEQQIYDRATKGKNCYNLLFTKVCN